MRSNKGGHKHVTQETSVIRDKLRSLMTKLDQEDELGKSGQATVALDQQAVGRLSRMDALQSQSMAHAQQNLRHQQRSRIAGALARLDRGTYGLCVDCDESIEPKRLDFDPTIAKCLSCAKG